MPSVCPRWVALAAVSVILAACVNGAEVSENTHAAGTISSVKKGTILKMVSGSIYEVTATIYEYPHAIRPEVVVLKDGAIYKLIMDGVDSPIICSRLVPARGTAERRSSTSPGRPAQPFSRAKQEIDPQLFKRVQRALVVLETPRGSGSAFVLETDSKKYLITNDHVLQGGRPFRARLLDGSVVRTQMIEVADDRDLVRLALPALSSPPALRLAPRGFAVGDRVGVFGNSDGAAVATSISGKILGMGPDTLEIDAAFVRGNSGSPIVLTDGHVVGVATFAILNADPDDWLKSGTRFSEPRRFGVRMDGVRWVRMTEEEYFVRADYIADLATFCNDVYDLFYGDVFYDKRAKRYIFEAAKEGKRYRRSRYLPESLARFVAEYQRTSDRRFDLEWRQDASRWGSMSPYERKRAQKRRKAEDVGAETRAFMRDYRLEHCGSIHTRLSKFVKKNDWKTRRMASDATYWLDCFKALALSD